MLDLFHLTTPKCDLQRFNGPGEYVWQKPRHAKMVYIFGLGPGGNGGNGAAGAAEAAAGGGGGGSGSQATLMTPAVFVPDRLWITLSTTTTVTVKETQGEVSLRLLLANGGGNGGNATGATPGVAGSAGATVGVNQMYAAPFAVAGAARVTGQSGQAGSLTTAANVIYPANGLKTSAGTGGNGLAAAATKAGDIVAVQNEFFPTLVGPTRNPTINQPGIDGVSGIEVSGILSFYGGTGGAAPLSTTTIAVAGGNGGAGSYGGGGGGGSGTFTGGTPGQGGRGGPGLVIIISW